MSGEPGNFSVEVVKHPRYVDMEKCIACGTCAEKCPKKVDDAFNENLIKRKAVYVQYAQAVPLKYAIDKDNCIFFEKGKCRACEKFCPTKAITPTVHRVLVRLFWIKPITLNLPFVFLNN